MGAEKEDPKKNITRLSFGMSTAQAAGGTVATHYANAAGQSMEQMWNPVQIVKGKPQGQTPTPGFEPLSGGGDESGTWGSFQHVGPTSLELDPYFSNILAGDDGTEFFAGVDYNLIVHEDSTGTTTDLNIKKIENNDVCGSYLGHPRVGVSTTDPFFESAYTTNRLRPRPLEENR